MRRLRVVAASLFALTLLLTACGDDDDTATDDTTETTADEATSGDSETDGSDTSDAAGDEADEGAGSGSGDVIDIVDFEYDPMELTAAPGTEVTVTNADGTAHTTTADDGEFDAEVAGGEEGTFTAPEAAGTYSYYCKFHPFMEGTLVVE